MLIIIGCSPIALNIVLGYKDNFSASQIVANFFAVFSNGDIVDMVLWLVIKAIYLFIVAVGVLYIKNAKNALLYEFRDDCVMFAKLDIKTKGDVLATGFGYFQDYETIKYKDITIIETVKKGKINNLKISTKEYSKMLNIFVSDKDAEEIKAFIRRKTN